MFKSFQQLRVNNYDCTWKKRLVFPFPEQYNFILTTDTYI